MTDKKTRRDKVSKDNEIYHASDEELRVLDEAEESGIASKREVEAAFRTFRRKS